MTPGTHGTRRPPYTMANADTHADRRFPRVSGNNPVAHMYRLGMASRVRRGAFLKKHISDV